MYVSMMFSETECKKMPATARVDAQILSDTAGKNQNKLTSNTGGKLDYKATCFLKLLTGLCIGQMVMLIAIAASLGAIIRNNVSHL